MFKWLYYKFVYFGLGIGLAIFRKIVRWLNGDFFVYQVIEGYGIIFCLIFLKGIVQECF